MTTAEALDVLAEHTSPATSIISSLGRTSEEAFRRFPGQTLFLDSMGDVAPIAVGVALGLGPSHSVVALDTDGSQLFYESGGALPSGSASVHWSTLGRAFGLPIRQVSTARQFSTAMAHAFQGFSYLVLSVTNLSPSPPASKPLDGIESKYRFIRHLEEVTRTTILRPATKS
jgi:hypothetical protein